MIETTEVKPRSPSPCDGCQVGWCMGVRKVENGKVYAKVEHCEHTCFRYQLWCKGLHTN